MSSALGYYGAALRAAAAGEQVVLDLIHPQATQTVRRLAPAQWCEGLRSGDDGVLARCHGPSLDVGCGPGRFAAALATAGKKTLGIDISAEAVRQARRHGAPAERTNVFAPVPDEGAWRHVLLMDGNIGIGGDPDRLLRRCRELLAAGGDIMMELDPPGMGSWRGQVRLRHRDRTSHTFPWAAVAADDLDEMADRSACVVLESWAYCGRWFARVAPRSPTPPAGLERS